MLQLLDIILSATGFGIRATIFPFSRDKLDELGAEWKSSVNCVDGLFRSEKKVMFSGVIVRFLPRSH